MHKRTGFGLIFGGLIAGVLATSFFMSSMPAPAAEPTRVPVPTFTPTPSSTQLGAIQGEYAELATQHQQALAQAMTKVAELLASPRLGDELWQKEVAGAMDAVETAYAHLLRLEPDEKWASFHREMTTGAADCNAAMRVLGFAIEEQDRDAVGVVGALLGRCQSHLVAAEQLVKTAKQP